MGVQCVTSRGPEAGSPSYRRRMRGEGSAGAADRQEPFGNGQEGYSCSLERRRIRQSDPQPARTAATESL